MTAAARNTRLDPGSAFMRNLRLDHAGLSRVLREIDTQVGQLAREPERARTVLIEALDYLLHYHHSYHHPREDRMFARIRARDSGLDETLQGLTHEHETGERQTGELAAQLAALSHRQLRGQRGRRLADQINGYVRHTRIHMRNEEAVFYRRAERVLEPDDWRDIVAADDGSRDPMTDLALMRDRYPHLAEHLGLPVKQLGLVERTQPVSEELRLQMLALTDLYGGLIHEALELARGNVDQLLGVRSPSALVRAVGEISSNNLRFAGQCLTRPPRWAINGGAALVVACLKPYLKTSQSGDA